MLADISISVQVQPGSYTYSLTTIKKKQIGVLVLLLQKGYYATFSILLLNEKKANTEKVCKQRTLIIKAKLNIWKKKKKAMRALKPISQTTSLNNLYSIRKNTPCYDQIDIFTKVKIKLNEIEIMFTSKKNLNPKKFKSTVDFQIWLQIPDILEILLTPQKELESPM